MVRPPLACNGPIPEVVFLLIGEGADKARNYGDGPLVRLEQPTFYRSAAAGENSGLHFALPMLAWFC